MAWINKPPKKERQRNEHTVGRDLRKKAYSNTQWRKVRNTYFISHPLCEKCLAKGITKAGEDVHHKKSPFINGQIVYSILLDDKNLMTLCKECHAEEHTKSQAQIIDDLDRLLNDNTGDN